MGKKVIVVVEDNLDMGPAIVKALEGRLGVKVIWIRSFQEFERLIKPKIHEVAVFFLDVGILNDVDDTTDYPVLGIRLATWLFDHHPKIPRYCISATDEWKKIADKYTAKVEKYDYDGMVKVAAEALR